MKAYLVSMSCLVAALIWLGSTQLAHAQKKGQTPKDDSQDLLDAMGDLGGGGGLSDLKQATDGVGPAEQKRSPTLDVKQKAETGDGKVSVLHVFAAPKIAMVQHKCQAKPKRIEFFVASDFPLRVDRFSVCAQMTGGRSRAMRMSVMITTNRGKMVGSAESVVDFTGKKTIDHAIDFVPLEFPEAGVYRYVIDIEGERVANMPLFEVRPAEGAEDLPE